VYDQINLADLTDEEYHNLLGVKKGRKMFQLQLQLDLRLLLEMAMSLILGIRESMMSLHP